MTQVHYNPPPALAEAGGVTHHGLCEICLMFAKGDQVAATRETWEPLLDDGKAAEHKWIAYQGDHKINDAVTRGVCDILPGLLLALCWDHLGAIAPPDPRPVCSWCHGSGRRAGVQPAAGALPPGFLNGGKQKGRG